MKKRINTLLSVTLLLAFCFTVTAQAQVVALAEELDTREEAALAASNATPIDVLSATNTVSEAWFAEIDRQYATALKDAESREQALQEVIYIATRFSEKGTFNKVVAPLVGVYIFDKNKNHRLMALSALHAIGDKYGMQRLRELVNDEPSEQVRRLTRRALSDYYGNN